MGTESRLPRVPEPELMLGAEQARAYAAADFEAAHSRYPELFQEHFPDPGGTGCALDLGCGPCDVTIRFARLLAGWSFDAVEGSAAMLDQARERLAQEKLEGRIRLVEGIVPAIQLPRDRYDLILATSLLHHLSSPNTLWTTTRRYSRTGTRVFVADLRRPEDDEQARFLVDRHAAGEPPVLRHDFFHSLLAAFTAGEVRSQLAEAGLTELAVEELGDRHLLVFGTIRG